MQHLLQHPVPGFRHTGEHDLFKSMHNGTYEEVKELNETFMFSGVKGRSYSVLENSNTK